LTQPKKYDIIERDVAELVREWEKCARNCLIRSAAQRLEKPRRWAEMAEKED
jgi:hypothetical protein